MKLAPSVLIIADHFAPAFRAGGPVRSLSAVVDLPLNIRFVVITRNRDLRSRDALEGVESGTWQSCGPARVLYIDTRSLRCWWRCLRELARAELPVWYLNSLFSPLATLVPLVIRRIGIVKPSRVILAPRGELSGAALAISAPKKRLLLAAAKRVRLYEGLIWHATSESERLEIEAVFGSGGTDVLLAMQVTRLPAEPAPYSPPPSGEPTRAVFLSRISQMKNLLTALRALAHAEHPVRLRVYGPIEDSDYWARCIAVIRELPARHLVEYMGELPAVETGQAFEDTDVFVFPTLGENFGHVIFEALSLGCPVILGPDTPWTNRVTGRCGWVVQATDAKAVGLALDELRRMPQEQVHSMRRQSRDAASEWAAEAEDLGRWRRLLLG